MYNRQHGQRRPPTIPQNYSGNAFYRVPYTESEPDETPFTPSQSDSVEDGYNEVECDICSSELSDKSPQSPSNALPFNLGGKLFPRGLGGEELLILALILTLSQSDYGNELLFYLILLLFC